MNKILREGKDKAKDAFEAKRLTELTKNGIVLSHADNYNFTITEDGKKTRYYGRLGSALKSFNTKANTNLNWEDYTHVKPSMDCSSIVLKVS